MKFYRIEKIDAVQWRGWPHKLKGVVEHPKYPQLATLEEFPAQDIYPNEYIVTIKDGFIVIMRDYNFESIYKRFSPKNS